MKNAMKTIMAAGMLAAAPMPLLAQDAAAADDNLVGVTCADFNVAAQLAVAEEGATEDRVELAQTARDEIVLGLTWMHGYLYAYRRDAMPALSQDWLRSSAEMLAERCAAAPNPAAVRIIDLADVQ
ncbi:hypothetical protein [Parasphingopyxis sp.]|uniref:hypothetical protein n=1 Tax=Parasphingopyxis sp. TaxID=1920299 RepID=UPI0026052979|nr:hypothetical protein [Parasphingopyxis sp.]